MKYFKFTRLTIELWRKRITHMDAAKSIGISVSCFNRKLDAKRPWTLPEMYKLTALLGKDTPDWTELFPNIYEEAKHNGEQ